MKIELNLLKTEEAVSFIKERFAGRLADNLNLVKVSAPLFVDRDSGFQDNLNGTEQPVSFKVKEIKGKTFEVVHSLAKWKRCALAKFGLRKREGIYTDMNAIRPDEPSLKTGIHSVFVDQWDWEMALGSEERNIDTLHEVVKAVYEAVKGTEEDVYGKYGIQRVLPEEIKFIHTEDLVQQYPELSAKERETAVCREFGAVFLIGIGSELKNGQKHDGRAPDYDDWTTDTYGGRKGLNGDILLWNPAINSVCEISSMGIRVDSYALLHQLKLCGCEERALLPWHSMVLKDELPESVGGGIGQSRLCMFLLRKKHIGEVQAGVWPDYVMDECKVKGLSLL